MITNFVTAAVACIQWANAEADPGKPPPPPLIFETKPPPLISGPG